MCEADYSVMIQKLDKRALALRIFGKDSDPIEGKGEGNGDVSVNVEAETVEE